MPPDTTYYPGETGPPPPTQEYRDSLEQAYYRQKAITKNESYTGLASFFFVVILGIVAMGIYRRIPYFANNIRRRNPVKNLAALVASAGIQYHDWLKQHNPYYNTLSPLLQRRFLQRTIVFMQSKEFRFHSMQEEEYIKVLVSGAAVQVTFGLQNYLLDFFPVIHVIRKEYILDIDNEMYDGHVSRTGIYISWNHFTEGFEDYTDCRNVGLHEMAHAVAYDVFLGQEDHDDWKFKQRLQEFREDGIPIFRAMREKCNPLLDSYGATNFDEFWAVCVETFFENPADFATAMPDLYASLVELLNQDPVKPAIIVNETVAGIVN